MNEFFYEPTVKVLMLKGEKGKGIVSIEKKQEQADTVWLTRD